MPSRSKMPDWLEPMAATLTQERFGGPGWLFERKFDGIRLLAYKRGPSVQLFSRNRLPQHLPHVAAAVSALPVNEAIFDILWLDGRLIAKRSGSPYEHRRSKHWLKMKCEASQELVVGGFTDPQGARVGLGALLVGYYDGNDFVFAGKIGTGFDTKLLLA
ncbi:MAG TPA: hypothetical protein VFO48_12565 [Vicinamibacterales bacterium]|nr:hypothetical protein [Vicinamibacterales bacterium]